MNLIHIAGHLGSDPEVRHTPNGQKVITFRIATHSRKGGQDVTIWYRVTIWGDRFDRMLPYLKKGTGLIVSGDLQKPEIYTDRNGQTQISLEITAESIRFSPFGKPERGGEPGERSQGQPAMAAAATSPYNLDDSASDDDLPF